MHYELNFSRMASVWPNTSLERSDYALTCVMYGIHLEDAKSLVQGFYGFNSTYVKMIEQRIARHRLSNEVNQGPFQREYKINSYFLIGSMRIYAKTKNPRIIVRSWHGGLREQLKTRRDEFWSNIWVGSVLCRRKILERKIRTIKFERTVLFTNLQWWDNRLRPAK